MKEGIDMHFPLPLDLLLNLALDSCYILDYNPCHVFPFYQVKEKLFVNRNCTFDIESSDWDFYYTARITNSVFFLFLSSNLKIKISKNEKTQEVSFGNAGWVHSLKLKTGSMELEIRSFSCLFIYLFITVSVWMKE